MSTKWTKKSGGDFKEHPACDEPIRAVVVDVTEPVEKETQWGKKEKFAIVFETEMVDEEGNNLVHWAHGYTPSLHEKSRLAKDVMKILGVSSLPDELDPETIIGKPVKLMIEHRAKRDGDGVFAEISYLKADPGGMKPSGKFVRKKDREPKSNGGGASYNKLPKGSGVPEWHETRVHIGQFAGHTVADLPSEEAVDKLLQFWWPKVEGKPSADDKRLHAALLEAKAVFQKSGSNDEMKF
jgi:hypothetical protein